MPEHIPVLFNETLALLQPKEGDTVLDATVGFGGHAEALCARIGSKGRLIGLDRDGRAIEASRKRLARCPGTVILEKESFRTLGEALERQGIQEVQCILFDLGMSSYQLDASGRGFSFRKDEPLLMTFDDAPSAGKLTAKDIVNEWASQDLANIFHAYGEERFARRIASALVSAREEAQIETSRQLAEIVFKNVPAWYRAKKIHPATKVFQALRITVNDELDTLKEGLAEGFERLARGGRMAVISFHRLEDRIAKTYFATLAEEHAAKILTRKPITAAPEEVFKNPRARSAKLRGIQKI